MGFFKGASFSVMPVYVECLFQGRQMIRPAKASRKGLSSVYLCFLIQEQLLECGCGDKHYLSMAVLLFIFT
jgi:hypothetical protein